MIKVTLADGVVNEYDIMPSSKVLFRDFLDYLSDEGIHLAGDDRVSYSLKIYRVTGH